jgi:lipopolysaccharide export system protein LptC
MNENDAIARPFFMPIHSIAYYTRFVNSAKLLLGILVLLLTALMFAYPVIKKNSGLRIAFTSSEKTAAPPPTQMVNANFHGFDDTNQPYNVAARTAVQVDEDNMTFDKVNGDISLNSGVWFTIQADNGRLKVKERLLNLNGAIEMFNDEGYEMRTDTLNVDIGKKIAATHDPVNGQGPLGILRAHGAVFDGNAKTAIFSGPVFVTLYLPPKEATKKDERK